MKKALILHGWGGHDQENWFPWLKNTLEKQGFEVATPNLPKSDFPDFKIHIKYIKPHIETLKNGDYIIGHSLGCTLALQAISYYQLENINFVLVAPANIHTPQECKKFFGIAQETIETFFKKDVVKNSQNNFIVMLSDNDPYINKNTATKYFHSFQNMNIYNYSNKGHFNGSAGITELPEILEFIKK